MTIRDNDFHHTELNAIQVIGQTAADGDLHLQITDIVVSFIDDDAGGGFGVVYGIEVTTNSPSSHDIFLDIRNNDRFNINAHDIRVRQATVNRRDAVICVSPPIGGVLRAAPPVGHSGHGCV